ncbi:MAG: hypothetical protein JRG73_11740 [Deltaproteobacteria bacterium]|nr:hypothetical protein [Deltaproteobacteria bacterium]
MLNHHSKKNILFYCQHLWGIGHLMRAAALARVLAHHRVHLVLGGRVVAKALASPTFRVHRLAPLGCDDAVTHLVPLQRGRTLEAVKRNRRRKLLALLDAVAPDLAVVEMFPFGRPWFRFELVPMLEALHREGIPVVCSVRDVLVRKEEPTSYARQVLEDLERYFLAVLVHSDPCLIRLEETFPAADRIPVPLYYTGYVDGAGNTCEQAPPQTASTGTAGQGGLLAWTGSGALGGSLLEAILEATAQGLLTYVEPMRIFTGPCLDGLTRSRMAHLAKGAGRVVLKTFTRRLRYHLARSRIALCMAGYMSAVDIMATRIPAVMVPGVQGGEQPFRARKLEEAGYVRVLPLDSLSPQSLAEAVQKALRPREKPQEICLEGAAQSVKILEAIMDGRHIPQPMG